MIKVDQRVRVVSLDTSGTVKYIDWPYLHHEHMYPVQIELESKYYDDKQPNAYMYRTGLRDLESI